MTKSADAFALLLELDAQAQGQKYDFKSKQTPLFSLITSQLSGIAEMSMHVLETPTPMIVNTAYLKLTDLFVKTLSLHFCMSDVQ